MGEASCSAACRLWRPLTATNSAAFIQQQGGARYRRRLCWQMYQLLAVLAVASSGTCGVGCIGDAVFHCQAAVAVPVMAYFAVAAAAKWLCRLLCGEICLCFALAFEVVATTLVTPPRTVGGFVFCGVGGSVTLSSIVKRWLRLT